jgi:hypothetical protein
VAAAASSPCCACTAAVAEGVVSLAVMMPVPLSYFSPIVGGLPGATALGLEPTYYWDAFTVDELEWVNHDTPPSGKVAIAGSIPVSWVCLSEMSKLAPAIRPKDPGEYAWYVIQNRPRLLLPRDHILIATGRPALVVKKLGVPLVWVFPYAQAAGVLNEPTR